MPTVDEDGRSNMRSWSCVADQARVRADMQKRAMLAAKALYDGALDDSAEAHRAARAAMGTDDFERLLLRAKGLHFAARIAEASYQRAYAAWHDLDRMARKLESERRAS